MVQFSQRFFFTALPTTQQETKDLTTKVTRDFGAKGWRLVAAIPVGEGSALLAFEKLFETSSP